MTPSQTRAEQARRAAERRQREDDAPRLLVVVPKLRALQIAFSAGEGGSMGTVDHVRHVVVGRAPALFTQRCANPACKEGEHELTTSLVPGLQRGEPRIEGEDPCLAVTKASACRWILRWTATASYLP